MTLEGARNVGARHYDNRMTILLYPVVRLPVYPRG